MSPLTVVGLGPLVEDLIVPRALDALASADTLFCLPEGDPRLSDFVARLSGEAKVQTLDASKDGGASVETLLAELSAGKRVTLAVRGDPAIFSGFAVIARELGRLGHRWELVPGVLAASLLVAHNPVSSDQSILIRGPDASLNPSDVFDISTAVSISGPRAATGLQGIGLRAAESDSQPVSSQEAAAAATEAETGANSRIAPGLVFTSIPHLAFDDPASGTETVDVGIAEGVYRRLGDVELRYSIVSRNNARPAPALLLFHGGGWEVGSRHQFLPHGQVLAAAGLTVITMDYRIKSKHETTPFESVDDAQFAYRWAVENAADLGIDPERIAIGGGSAGAHIAIGVSLFETHDTGAERFPPKAFVMFNPVTDTGPAGFGVGRIPGDTAVLDVNLKLRAGLAPAIVFHGTEDQLVPVQNSIDFAEKSRLLGNECRLNIYPGVPHAFFNYGFNGSCRYFYDTTEKIADFLCDLGLLPHGAGARVRLINRRDEMQNLIDATRSRPSLVEAVNEINRHFVELESTLKAALAQQGRDGPIDTNKILNNLRALTPRINRLNTLIEYSKT
jgi:acetyl esterase